MRQWLETGFAVVVVVLWVVSSIADLIVRDYDPRPELTPLVLTVATYLLGRPLVSEMMHRDRSD